MIFYIVTILILLALSAFFSAAETSLTTSSRAAMHQRAKEGNRRAKTVMKLKNDSESVISAILLGNNLLNILATAITTAFLARWCMAARDEAVRDVSAAEKNAESPSKIRMVTI